MLASWAIVIKLLMVVWFCLGPSRFTFPLSIPPQIRWYMAALRYIAFDFRHLRTAPTVWSPDAIIASFSFTSPGFLLRSVVRQFVAMANGELFPSHNFLISLTKIERCWQALFLIFFSHTIAMLWTLPYSFLASSIKSGYLQKWEKPSKWCIQCYFKALFKWYFRALFKTTSRIKSASLLIKRNVSVFMDHLVFAKTEGKLHWQQKAGVTWKQKHTSLSIMTHNHCETLSSSAWMEVEWLGPQVGEQCPMSLESFLRQGEQRFSRCQHCHHWKTGRPPTLGNWTQYCLYVNMDT